MKLSTKILIIAGAILALAAFTFIIIKQIEISSQQTALQGQIVEQKQLVDGIMRAQSSYASKDDVDKIIQSNNINLKAIQDDLDKLHSEIFAINITTADSNPQQGNNLPTTNTGPVNPHPVQTPTCKDGSQCPNPDAYGYLTKEQDLSLNEDFGSSKIPFGSIGFSAWQQNPWNINISPREYKISNVIAQDENQKVTVYNKFTVKVNDKEYTVPIQTAQTTQVLPTAKFSWWNPKVFLTAGGSVNTTGTPSYGDFNIGATFGFMSWGKFKTNPTLSIMQAGIGYNVVDKQPAIIINPVNFNLGTVIPIISNTYIGPSIQMDFPKFRLMVGANLSVAL